MGRSPVTVGAAQDERAADLEALLVALVLVPASYSRNRFFELYKDPARRRVRRRAAQLRSVVAELVECAEAVRVAKFGCGFELSYRLRDRAAARRLRLEPHELALVAAVVHKSRAPENARPLVDAVGEAPIALVTPVLARLFER
jgi:hypothetical protein